MRRRAAGGRPARVAGMRHATAPPSGTSPSSPAPAPGGPSAVATSSMMPDTSRSLRSTHCRGAEQRHAACRGADHPKHVVDVVEHAIRQARHHNVRRAGRSRHLLDVAAQVVGNDRIVVRRMRQRAFRQSEDAHGRKRTAGGVRRRPDEDARLAEAARRARARGAATSIT